ncbi:MAG: hypothetical protein JOZ74_01125 [Bradyrhizobium sp.]|nr:hypothetical protein [Bradyrhizobium sp.]
MDRIFLAVIVSGLLLAAVAVFLFVASTGGETTVSLMNIPPAPSMPIPKRGPRHDEEDRTMPQDRGR